METTDQQPSYSISFRLQRTITEERFVKVLVTSDLIVRQPDGSGKLNVEKVMERAIELGQASDVVWTPESCDVHLHPIQIPPPG